MSEKPVWFAWSPDSYKGVHIRQTREEAAADAIAGAQADFVTFYVMGAVEMYSAERPAAPKVAGHVFVKPTP